MKNAAPEAHDFRFTHLNINYAVGYQDQDDVLALSKQTDNGWTWVVLEQYIKESLDTKTNTIDKMLNKFIKKVNDNLPKVDGDGIPKEFTGEIKKMLLLVKNGLKFSGGVLSRI